MSQVTSSADTHAPWYRPPRGGPEWLRVPDLAFVAVEGHGSPNTSASYREALESLFAVSWTLRFALRATGVEFHVGPLETLWWAEDMTVFEHGRLEECSWSAMIGQPDAVTQEHFAAACERAAARKPLPALDRARLVRITEGTAAQVLHVGPYDAEGPTIARLHEFIRADGRTFDGRVHKHHEIYLGDPRRTDASRWRTIIRQPVAAEPEGAPS